MRDRLAARLAQLRSVYSATRQADDRLLPFLVGVPLVLALAIGALGWWALGPVFGIVLALAVALLAAAFVFGRRASKAQFIAMRGHPGAAAAVMQSMRGAWVISPAVAVTRQQDLVHRAVGRAGVVLVGEGRPARTTQLLRQEQRRVARAVGDTPVHTVLVGDGDGQVPLDKLRSHLTRLPKGLGRKEIAPVNKRLGALGHGDLPIPKGPIPGGAKMPRPKRR